MSSYFPKCYILSKEQIMELITEVYNYSTNIIDSEKKDIRADQSTILISPLEI